MKRIFVLILLLCCQTGFAQKHFLKKVQMQKAGNDLLLEVTASIHTFLGQAEYRGFDMVASSNSYIVNCYYLDPLVGSWILGNNILTDTINLGTIPPNIKELYINMYTLVYHDTIPDTIYQSPKWTLFLPLSIGNTDKEVSAISIYPNPNKGRFWVEAPPGSSALGGEVTVLKVANMFGQVVYTDNIAPVNGAMKQEVDMGDAPTGVYMLRVHTGSGVLTRRFNVVR